MAQQKSNLHDLLMEAESLLVAGQDEAAEELLSRLAEDAEEYVSRNCPTTDEVQWFSFPSIFERLAYRRVEEDPRELMDFGEPLDILYADLALACVRLGDYDRASAALKQAVRWNPMGCTYRLNLADLYKTNGDINEYLALTYTVFERASDVGDLVRAFTNFANYFIETGQDKAGAAALRCARRLDAPDATLEQALDEAKGTEHDPDSLTDEQTRDLLAQEGLPDGANAEIAICMLMCASDAAQEGANELATTLTIRARDLVGAQAASALVSLIKESGADA